MSLWLVLTIKKKLIVSKEQKYQFCKFHGRGYKETFSEAAYQILS